jgi:hypothetical protein
MKNTKTQMKTDNPLVDNSPVYTSMAQCAAITGIPLALIRQSKRTGCLAFEGSKVRLYALLGWIFNQSDSKDIGDWGEYFRKWHGMIEKLKHDQLAGKVIEKALVQRVAYQANGMIFNILDKAANEIPPKLIGKTAVDIHIDLKNMIEEIRAKVNAAMREIGKDEK